MVVTQKVISSLFKPNSRIPTPVDLNRLLQFCSNSKASNQGKQVHQQIIVHGSHQDSFMVTKLVQMYADCDDLLSAYKLFDKMPLPNVFAWTAVLAFYLRNGKFWDCVGAYCNMKWKGIVPDEYVFPKVLRVCGQFSCLEVGIYVHKDVVICGYEMNLLVCNSLIDMYAKCRDFWSGRRVFDAMVIRDLLSWNLLISGCVFNGLLALAVELLSFMRLDGFEPDVVTWNTVMDAYCRMGLCNKAWNIFEQIREPTIISWTTLISAYSRLGKHEKALGIFMDMVTRGQVCPDSDSLSSILVSCKHLGAMMNGKEIHGYGIKTESAVEFYNSAGPALLTMYAKCSRIQDARNVFGFMDKSDVVTWNAMILGYIDLRFEQLALECFGQMQRVGIQNDQTTISTILPVCDLKSGKQIHAHIRKGCFDFATPIWNALIHMYSKCGHIGLAYSVFSTMVTKDLVSWNTMIQGFGMHGLGQAALHLLEEMNYSGLKPDSMTLTSALSACSHSGLIDEGIKLFNVMSQDFGYTHKMEHFSCVVDMLARAGRIEDAVRFIQKMPIDPDKSIWGALLASCRDHHDIRFGQFAAERLILLEPEHAGNYVTLSNMYAKAGRWDDAVKVRQQMEDRGLVKLSGQSWIEGENL